MCKILVVDDIQENIDVLADILCDRGHVISQSLSGDNALQMIVDDPPDCILLDIVMPHMSGIEVCREINDNPETRNIPVILVSALSDINKIVEGLDCGAVDYIVKPFNSKIVKARVHAALRTKKAQDAVSEISKKLKLTNEDLERKNQQLSDFYKRAYQFVDNVTHELCTPLTVIKEYSSILSDGVAGPINDEQEEYLNRVLRQVDALTHLVNDMLDVSRLEANMMSVHRLACNVPEIINRVNDAITQKSDTKKIDLVIQYDEPLPKVYCDAEKIGRVLINLVINAIKFTPEQGRVLIRARHDSNASQVVISVSDNGCGMSKEDLKIIFDKFTQVGNSSSSHQGFGIGLSIVKDLVKLNLGQLTVESELEKGSTFSFSIPTDEPLTLIEKFLNQHRFQVDTLSTLSLITVQVDALQGVTQGMEIEEFLQNLVNNKGLVICTNPNSCLLICDTTHSCSSDIINWIQKPWEMQNGDVNHEVSQINIEVKGQWATEDTCEDILSICSQELEGMANVDV